MKLGILGTGMIVKDVLTMYHELGVEKTYLFSTKKSKSQALELMKKYHLDKVYTDYDELLQSDVDTIYCALPNHLHYEFSKKALENDKNVIIEKPITANSKELEDLIETANKKNLMIFEAMNLHYIPAFLSLKEDLKKLGDIKIVSFNYSQYSSRYNKFKNGIVEEGKVYEKGFSYVEMPMGTVHVFLREGYLFPVAKGGKCVEDVDFEDLTLYSFGEEIKPYEYYLDDGETKDFNMETHIRILSC